METKMSMEASVPVNRDDSFCRLSWMQRVGFGSGEFGSKPYLPDDKHVFAFLLY